MKIVLITGGFDPIHSGHIKYIEEASKLGDYLIVGLNSDEWLKRKKGNYFLPLKERTKIISAIRWVDVAFSFDDDDNSAINAILKVRKIYPDSKIIFANGGDRNKANIPELSVKDNNTDFVFGVGGEEKLNSSSWILQEWREKNLIK